MECEIKKIVISTFIKGKFFDQFQNDPIKYSHIHKASLDPNERLI